MHAIAMRETGRTIPVYIARPKNEKVMVEQYRRQCLSCGCIWYSLKSREDQIQQENTGARIGAAGGAMQSCGTCGMCGGAKTAQYSYNAQAGEGELARLRSCPQCGSCTYTEVMELY